MQFNSCAGVFVLFFFLQHSVNLYDALMEEGKTFDIRNVGSYALECLRVEIGIPLSGYELTSQVTPYEAGLESMIYYTEGFIFVISIVNLYI